MWCHAAFKEEKHPAWQIPLASDCVRAKVFSSQEFARGKQCNIIEMHLCAHMLPPSRRRMCCQSLSNVVFFLPLSWTEDMSKEEKDGFNTIQTGAQHKIWMSVYRNLAPLFWEANMFSVVRNVRWNSKSSKAQKLFYWWLQQPPHLF